MIADVNENPQPLKDFVWEEFEKWSTNSPESELNLNEAVDPIPSGMTMMNEMEHIEMKDSFCEILKSTGRAGVEAVIAELEKLGFFTAPASRHDHMACPGGLLEHSLNVYRVAMLLLHDMRILRQDLSISADSIAIAALLHDVCKSMRYVQNPYYGMDDEDRYLKVYSHLPVGHGEKSVIMLLRLGLELTDDEILAIRWHMSPWDLSMTNDEMSEDYRFAENACPLVAIIQAADKLAAKVLEF